MKVIDLLQRIANGEEVPKKIKYRNKIFIYDKDNQCYINENYNEYDDLHMSLSNHKGTDLHYEVEIIEEDKKIEKIDMFGYFTGYDFDGTSKDLLKHLERNFEIANEKLNEIIDAINEMMKDK